MMILIKRLRSKIKIYACSVRSAILALHEFTASVFYAFAHLPLRKCNIPDIRQEPSSTSSQVQAILQGVVQVVAIMIIF